MARFKPETNGKEFEQDWKYLVLTLMRIAALRFFGCFATKTRRQPAAACSAILGLALAVSIATVHAQAVSTTTVQGTVYLANGQPGAGTLVVSWPAFTTAAGQVIVADSTTETIAPDGFVSVNLTPNVGATPAGEYYTAVFYMSDGSTNTQYWVVPAAPQATLAQVQSQVIPAVQAVQTVSKSYVDQSIGELTQSLLTASGGNLSGPLYLNGDPTQPSQAADKHYVDTQVATALPLSGGTLSGSLSAMQIGAVYQADQFPGVDFAAKLQACLSTLDQTHGGTCDARNLTGDQTMGSNLTISTANTSVLLPCATIATSNQIVVTAGTRNVALHGCALRGGSVTSGSQGGTVFAYSGNGALVQVGDPTYSLDTPGFHMDNLVINTTGASNPGAQGLVAYRTQELDLESLYLLGNPNQQGITLDGTGNYTGGTFLDDQFTGFGAAVNAIGHQASNPATTDWMNASEFIRLHIDCPTNNGSPISGTFGINLQQGDGNTITGGDVEGCATALHLGPNAQNNTIVGLRNENSTYQIVADAGSAYNSWITGGTMFTGKVTDAGTRNSFLDTFHRSFNGLNGDWYGSQQDATVTNHFRLGIGNGNERGLLNRYQTDSGYRWTTGLSDASAGEQFYQVLDELNNVYRLSIGQFNTGQSSTNDQTVVNSAGTGAVVLNGSNNAGTGGVIIGSGGPGETTVATISNAGNAQFNGTLQVNGTSQSAGTMTVRNNTDAEVDYYLWPGLTASQKGSFTYKDWNGNSQWYLVKDASNNWALNSATGGLDTFKAYQSTNSGDTYIDTSNSSGHIRLNYETGAGAETDIYSGSAAALDAAFLGPTSIKFPGIAASSGHSCLQVDSSGYLSNTGTACGSGGASGTISSGSSGQIAYYTANGTTVGGMTAVPVAAGGTGAGSAVAALQNLGGLPTTGGTLSGPLTAPALNGPLTGNVTTSTSPWADIRAYGATIDGATDIGASLNAAIAAQCPSRTTGAGGISCTVLLPCGGKGCFLANGSAITQSGWAGILKLKLQGQLTLGSTLVLPDMTSLTGDGGCTNAQFLSSDASACVNGPNVGGTIGTPVTTTGSAVTFTPAFSQGTISNMPVNSAITVAGLETCTMSASRASSGTVTFTSSACTDSSGHSIGMRIPTAEIVNISNCSDSSFNGTGDAVVSSDFPAGVISILTTNATQGTATGCSVVGFNSDSFETVRITNVSGSVATATFAHAHAPTDQWGMVAIAPPTGTYGHHDIQQITVSAQGAAYWGDSIAVLNFSNDGFGAIGRLTSVPFELDGSWWGQIKNSVFETNGVLSCHTGCGQPGYPYSIRLSQDAKRNNGIAGSFMSLSDATIYGGVEIDGNGMPNSNCCLFPMNMRDIVFEHPAGAAVMIDNRQTLGGGGGQILGDNWLPQDNFLGNPWYYLGYTDANYYPNLTADLGRITTVQAIVNLTNKYFSGELKSSGMLTYAPLPTGRGVPPGVLFNNGIGEFEYRGEGASLGPSVIPYPTLPVATNPSCSGCSTVTGPDGTQDAFQVPGGGTVQVTVGSQTLSTSPGDRFLVGAWYYQPQGSGPQGFWGGTSPFALVSTADTWVNSLQCCGAAAVDGFDMKLNGDWWHPIVAEFTVATGNSTAHAISFNLTGSTSSAYTNDFYNWFWIYIPASANIPEAEVERWRQQLLHGAVPQNFSGVGVAASTVPIAVPNYNVLNPSTGAYAPFASSNLGDWSNGTPLNGQVPVYNSATGKWTPGANGGGATNIQITTGTTTIPANSCLPTNSTYYTAAMSGLATTSVVTGPTPTSDVNGVTGFNQAGPTLYFVMKPAANTLNWQLCNNTSSSITPSASITWNVGAR